MLKKTVCNSSMVSIGLLLLVASSCTKTPDTDNNGISSNAGASGATEPIATSTTGSGGSATVTGAAGVATGTGGAIATGAAGTPLPKAGSGGKAGAATTVTGGAGGRLASKAGTGGASGTGGKGQPGDCSGAYQFSAVAEGGGQTSLCDCKGDVLLIVNIAANCGYTPQLAGLAQLQSTYHSQGFTVLGFWNNQFLGQMGDPARREAVKTQYGVNFPLFEETNVNPPDEHPLYTWLKAQAGGGNVGWNFEKFLIGRDGLVLKRYLTQVTPESIASDIDTAIK